MRTKKSLDVNDQFYPTVTVMLAVYNEIDIIDLKMSSMLSSTYPKDRLQFLIGSDCSDDGTNEIIQRYADEFPHIDFFPFMERSGKAVVMENLLSKVKGSIIIFTDADTLFTEETIYYLVNPFSDPTVGGVQGNFVSIPLDKTETLKQESFFNRIEMAIKMRQSNQGLVIGAIGSIFAIRKSLYQTVPYGIIVDDFFLFMSILKNGWKTVFADRSISKLYVSGDSTLQFKRKKRIGSGNFMAYHLFKSISWPWKGALGYHFFSYKVLRWFGPFLMLLFLIGNMILFPITTSVVVLFGMGILGFDRLLRRVGKSWGLIRYPAHFFWMNAAMFLGYFQYKMKGNSAVWNNPKKLG